MLRLLVSLFWVVHDSLSTKPQLLWPFSLCERDVVERQSFQERDGTSRERYIYIYITFRESCIRESSFRERERDFVSRESSFRERLLRKREKERCNDFSLCALITFTTRAV